MSMPFDRRTFLAGLGKAGAALAAGSWLDAIGYAQASRGPARVRIQQPLAAADFDRRVLGSFLEHLGRAIYTGVYQPGSPLADANGFRTDVVARGQGPRRADHPLSGRQLRLRLQLARRRRSEGAAADGARSRLELARDESVRHQRVHRLVPPGRAPSRCSASTSAPAPSEMAVAYVEYCNVERGTKWSDLRRSHGYEQPHNVRYWCLGNEMDGPWQIGQLQAREYGRKARDAAKQMRVIDRGPAADRLRIERHRHADLPGLGPRSARGVLRPGRRHLAARLLRQHAGADGQQHRALPGDEPRHGSADSRDRGRLRLRAGAAASRASGCGCRSTSGTSGIARAAARPPTASGTFAPQLLEEVYNLEDALLVGGFVNTLLRNSDRVRVGCLAQLVNVIAPLVTNDTGVLRQSIYYPYAWALQYARGRVLDLRVESETYPITRRRAAGRLRAQRRRCRSSTWSRRSTHRTARRAC